MQKNKVMISVILNVLLVHLSLAQPISQPKVKWKFQSQSPVRGGISMRDDALYFGNAEGVVHCVNKNNGSVNWIFKTNGAVVSAPLVTGNKVIVSSRDNHVYGLESATGNQLWKFTMQPEPAHKWGWDYYMASPVVLGKTAFIGSGDHHLYALNADNGKLVWKFKTGNKVRATPLLYQGKLYAPSFDGIVYVLDPANGNLLWKFETEGAHLNSDDFGWDRNSINSTPVIQDSLMVFGSRDGSVYCVNINSHKQKWKFSYGPSWAIASPIIRNNAVLTSWSDNSLFCSIDLQSGKEKWKYNCGSYVYPNPVADEKHVYTGAGNGKVFAFDFETGALKWEYQTAGAVLSSPLLDHGTLYIGSDDGNVYAIEEGVPSFRAVYLPNTFKSKFIEQGMLVDDKIAPYFTAKGYQKLDSASLAGFMNDRVKDGISSVIVFAHDYLPITVAGSDPSTSLIRKYMEAGGKIVRPGQVPNMVKLDNKGNYAGVDFAYAKKLLGIKVDVPFESGFYFAKATQDGLNWGLSEKGGATNSFVSAEGLMVLAVNELGRPGIWFKHIGSKPYGGYLSCRTWSWIAEIQQKDLDILFSLAEYGL
jgi:outer membrane protein assembly factor BamB